MFGTLVLRREFGERVRDRSEAHVRLPTTRRCSEGTDVRERVREGFAEGTGGSGSARLTRNQYSGGHAYLLRRSDPTACIALSAALTSRVNGVTSREPVEDASETWEEDSAVEGRSSPSATEPLRTLPLFLDGATSGHVHCSQTDETMATSKRETCVPRAGRGRSGCTWALSRRTEGRISGSRWLEELRSHLDFFHPACEAAGFTPGILGTLALLRLLPDVGGSEVHLTLHVHVLGVGGQVVLLLGQVVHGAVAGEYSEEMVWTTGTY